ncbi:hypothetical protein RFI_24876 [Reticulomyxa filosa]|uniref:Uncharacterized protein n=1 Tax=Reticulomyxa filosa TaxID=46433 RepID=X6MGG6_RETFI|nr:hypothetical protein RFI_24876 [Reticulomyxa filosa]|eukprot:ETO12502.1 hypothetical protein RFI_24876 [Reticulomyxa filosa]
MYCVLSKFLVFHLQFCSMLFFKIIFLFEMILKILDEVRCKQTNNKGLSLFTLCFLFESKITTTKKKKGHTKTYTLNIKVEREKKTKLGKIAGLVSCFCVKTKHQNKRKIMAKKKIKKNKRRQQKPPKIESNVKKRKQDKSRETK